MGKAIWWVRGALLLALVGFLAYLKFSDHPWQGTAEKRLLSGADLAVEHYVQLHSWWAALINAVVIGLLLVTSGLWGKWLRPPHKAWSWTPPSRWNWAVMLLAVASAAIYRAPLLERDLLRDEQDNLRRNIFGYLERQEDGTLKFEDVSWTETLFENRLANNPILYSALARVSIDAWQRLLGEENERFSLVALRLPAFVAGLLSIAAIWWLLLAYGFPRSAGVAAVMAALHPMHAEYCLQARGYSLVMLFVVLAAGSAYVAIRTGRWLWWLLLGMCLVAMLYSYAGSIYAAAAVGIVTVIAGVQLWRKDRERGRSQFTKMAVAGLVVLCLYLQLIAPSLQQIAAHLSDKFEQIDLGAKWFFLAYLQYTAGAWFPEMKWGEVEGATSSTAWDYLLSEFFPANPGLSILIVLVLPALWLAGAARLFRAARISPWPAAIVLALGVSPLLSFIHHQFFTGLYLYFWYWIYGLPFLIILTALGTTWLGDKIATRNPREPAKAAIIIPVLFLLFYYWETKPGKYGRTTMEVTRSEEPLVFPRGSSNWVVHHDGRMIKEPRTSPEAEPPSN